MKKFVALVLTALLLSSSLSFALSVCKAGGGYDDLDFPVPSVKLINGDVVELVFSSVISLNGEFTVDDLQAILEPFGYSPEDVEALTDGNYTLSDFSHGRITSSVAESFLELYETEKENYARDLNAYITRTGAFGDFYSITADSVIGLYRLLTRAGGSLSIEQFKSEASNNATETPHPSAEQSGFDGPIPSPVLINGDIIEILCDATISSGMPLTIDDLAAILEPFGATVDDISDMTDGWFGTIDFETGLFTPDRAEMFLSFYETTKDTYARNLRAYCKNNEVEELNADEIIEWYRASARSVGISQGEEAQQAGNAAESLAAYEETVKHLQYISKAYNDPDVECFIISEGEMFIAGVDIPAAEYEISYMGDLLAEATIGTGTLYSEAYQLSSFSWDDAAGTKYEIYSYPLCPGFSISYENGAEGDSEYIFLKKLAEIAP